MDSRLVSFLVFCSLLAQPTVALGEHQWIDPRKPGGAARDPNALDAPALPLAPGAPAYSQPVDPSRAGGAQRDRYLLEAPPPAAAKRPEPLPTPAPPVVPASHSEATTRVTGTITSVTNTRLVLSSTAKGKKTTTTFVLEPGTTKQGTLKPGARVTVSYHVVRNDRVARRVEVQGTKAPAKSGARPAGTDSKR